MNAYLTRCPAAHVYMRERGDFLAKYAVVGSAGQRNGLFKGISGRLKAKRFSGPRVESQGKLIEVSLGVDG